MSQDKLQQYDDAIDLLYSFVEKFVNDDTEDFETQLREVMSMAYADGLEEGAKK